MLTDAASRVKMRTPLAGFAFEVAGQRVGVTIQRKCLNCLAKSRCRATRRGLERAANSRGSERH
jgi:hypothetical protein